MREICLSVKRTSWNMFWLWGNWLCILHTCGSGVADSASMATLANNHCKLYFVVDACCVSSEQLGKLCFPVAQLCRATGSIPYSMSYFFFCFKVRVCGWAVGM